VRAVAMAEKTASPSADPSMPAIARLEVYVTVAVQISHLIGPPCPQAHRCPAFCGTWVTPSGGHTCCHSPGPTCGSNSSRRRQGLRGLFLPCLRDKRRRIQGYAGNAKEYESGGN
jgi:hypothetical protein